MKKDLLSIGSLTLKEVEEIFDLAEKIKKNPKKFDQALKGKTLALIFEKPSNRTYVSFQVGMFQLGGNSVYLGPEQIKLGVRETVHDVAKTLSRYVDGIVLRTFGHDKVIDLAHHATVPVINGLSDYSHPCQALADIFTLKEKKGNLKNLTITYVGDGNNVCNSLMLISSKIGMNMNVATPVGYEPLRRLVDDLKGDFNKLGVKLEITNDPMKAAKNADLIYTDVWASMGQEAESEKRKQEFKNFQVNKELVNQAKKSCLIMHCLPAHRGEEITDEVCDSKESVIFDEAENRLHVQKAILVKLLGDKK